MPELTGKEIALASFVALRVDGWHESHGCAAWVESKDATCKRDVQPGTALCKRHRTVAERRQEKHQAATLNQAQRRPQYRAEHLDEWKAELAQVEADMERYGGLPTTDRAAYGGVSHPSIQKAQLRQLSDTNVQRMARLSERAQRLHELIGEDE